MTIRLKRVAALAVAAAAASACGQEEKVQTRGEVLEKYRAGIEAAWANANAVFALEPTEIAAGVVASQVKPFATRNGGYAEDTNIAIFPADQFFHGDKPLVDLYFRSPLRDAHEYIAGDYPSLLEYPTDAHFETTLQAAVATPYVGVYTVQAYDPPERLDAKTFKPGSVSFMLGVMDIANKSMIAACQITAASDETVELPPGAGWESGVSHVKGPLDDNARALAARCLAEQAHGQFSFD